MKWKFLYGAAGEHVFGQIVGAVLDAGLLLGPGARRSEAEAGERRAAAEDAHLLQEHHALALAGRCDSRALCFLRK